MPTINLGRKKKRDWNVSKHQQQSIYQNKRWKEIRAEKVMRNPVCERCAGLGMTRQTECVHHIIPWETGITLEEQEELAFDINNTESLCHGCHVIRHKELNYKRKI
jgi:hypothetical protein